MAGSALDIFMSALGNGTTNTNNLNTQLAEQGSRANNAGEEQLAVLKDRNDAQKVIDEQKAKADAETQAVNQNVATALGGNAKSPTFVLATLGQQMREATTAAMDAAREVTRLDSTSFFDNPLAWLPNQFKADQLSQIVNDQNQAATIAASSMERINSIMSTGAAAQKATQEDITKATTIATLNVAAANAQLTSSKLEQDIANRNMDVTQALQTGDTHKIELAKAGWEAQVSQEHLAMARQSHIDSHAEFLLNQQLRRDQAEANKENRQLTVEAKKQRAEDLQATDTALTHDLNVTQYGLNSLGYPQFADQLKELNGNPRAWEVKRKSMLATPDGKAMLDTWQVAAYSKTSTGDSSFGPDPGSALELVAKMGRPNLAPQALDVLDWMKDSARTAIDKNLTGVDKQAKAKTLKEQFIVGGNAVLNESNTWRANVEKTGSKMAALPLAEFSTSKQVVETPLWQKVLAPQLAGGSGDSSYKTVSELALAAVETKQITFNEAVDGIAKFYDNAIVLNNGVRQFPKFGILPQQSYPIRVETIAGVTTIDAKDPTQVRSDLLLRNNKFLKYIQNNTFLPELGLAKDTYDVYELFNPTIKSKTTTPAIPATK